MNTPSFLRNQRSLHGRVYFDHAASTPVDEQVLRAMQPYWNKEYANPGGRHLEGERAREALEMSRRTCAGLIGAKQDEVIFTGSGTESNNLALFGTIKALLDKGKQLSDLHVITTTVEHPSILDGFKDLEKKGLAVTYLPVSEEGLVSAKRLKDSLQENTVLVSVMYVNNEVGAIMPVVEIGKFIRQFKRKKKENEHFPYFHVDASQAGLFEDVMVEKLSADLLTLDAQKMYGPKGIGLLYKKETVSIKPIIIGGNQEQGLRPGTENVPLIVGFAKTLSLAVAARAEETVRLRSLRDYCIGELQEKIPHVVINGPQGEHIEHRIANNVNISIPNMNGAFLTVALSEKGFACGTRSACIGREGGPSYVLTAMNKSELAENSLRLTFGKQTRKKDITRFVQTLGRILANFDNLHK